jgi:prolactin regulatory element-binding protein
MARGTSSETKKYGQPLYASAWLDERTALVAGGGGKKSSGIPNRILIASYNADEDQLGEAESWTHTDEDAPQRLAAHPSRTHVVCAFGGSLGVFRTRRNEAAVTSTRGDRSAGGGDGAASASRAKPSWIIEPCVDLGLPPRVSVTPDEREIKCAAFNGQGTRLALGLESGEVKILSWPSLEVEKELGAHEKGAVTDIAWAPDGDGLLTTSAENATTSNIGRGACVWSVERGERVRTLFDESIVKTRARNVVFRGAAFGPKLSSSTSGVAWTGLNLDGEGWVVKWDTATWRVLSKARVFNKEPISGFAVNAQGTLVAVGSSEGHVKVMDALKFTPIKRVKGAHMIFVTTMAWNPKGNVILSGSADASGNAMKIRKRSWTLRLILWLTVLVLLTLFWLTILQFLFPDPLVQALESGDFSRAAQAVSDYFSEGKNHAGALDQLEEMVEDVVATTAAADAMPTLGRDEL